MQNIPSPILSVLQSQFGTIDPNQFSVMRWQYYDFIRYPAAGATSLSFFSVAQGGVDPTSSTQKTAEQTNMPQTRQFGDSGFMAQLVRTRMRILPKGRQVAGIKNDTHLISETLTLAMPKLAEIIRRGTLNIKFSQTSFFEINQPLMKCPPGYGPRIQQYGGYFDSAGTAKSTLWVQQYPKFDGVYGLDPFQFIESSTTLHITIDYPSTSPVLTGLVDGADLAVEIGVILDGYKVAPKS